MFLADLMLPGVAPSRLWTRRPGLDAKLNDGPFSERRWAAAVPKLIAGEYGVLYIQAADPGRGERTAQLSIVVNPTTSGDAPVAAEIELGCSISYARELARAPERVDALLRIGVTAWTSLSAGALYGYANVAYRPRRAMFGQPGWRPPGFDVLASMAPPHTRPHPIPVAYLGDVDGNLAALYRAGRGIKGAFWANFLAGRHVRALGGEAALRASLPGVRIEPLEGGGVLVVATPSPLPDDSADNRRRFEMLTRVLEPAFLSRAETPENKRALLGHFCRP